MTDNIITLVRAEDIVQQVNLKLIISKAKGKSGDEYFAAIGGEIEGSVRFMVLGSGKHEIGDIAVTRALADMGEKVLHQFQATGIDSVKKMEGL